MKTLLIRIDDDLHAWFKDFGEHTPGGMQGAILKHIGTLKRYDDDNTIRHLDGSICPVSATVQAIAAAVHLQIDDALARATRPRQSRPTPAQETGDSPPTLSP
jgi:hypothetical protein